MLGMTKYQVSRIENGDTELTVDVARRAALALGVTLDELVGNAEQSPLSGFVEDMTPYAAPEGDALQAALTGDHLYPFLITTDAIDRAGYPRGMIIQISDARSDCANVKPLQPVRVLYHAPGSETKAVSLLRLFVPPKLLITNSSTKNMPNLDMDVDDAHIIGVVVAGYQKFTS